MNDLVGGIRRVVSCAVYKCQEAPVASTISHNYIARDIARWETCQQRHLKLRKIKGIRTIVFLYWLVTLRGAMHSVYLYLLSRTLMISSNLSMSNFCPLKFQQVPSRRLLPCGSHNRARPKEWECTEPVWGCISQQLHSQGRQPLPLYPINKIELTNRRPYAGRRNLARAQKGGK